MKASSSQLGQDGRSPSTSVYFHPPPLSQHACHRPLPASARLTTQCRTLDSAFPDQSRSYSSIIHHSPDHRKPLVSPPPPRLSLPARGVGSHLESQFEHLTSTSAINQQAHFQSLNNHQPGPRPKRKRITPEQLEVLSGLFEMTDTPTFDLRDSIGHRLGMTNREVQVWFQNRRAKVNRQRLQEQQHHQEKSQEPDRQPSMPSYKSPHPPPSPRQFFGGLAAALFPNHFSQAQGYARSASSTSSSPTSPSRRTPPTAGQPRLLLSPSQEVLRGPADVPRRYGPVGRGTPNRVCGLGLETGSVARAVSVVGSELGRELDLSGPVKSVDAQTDASDYGSDAGDSQGQLVKRRREKATADQSAPTVPSVDHHPFPASATRSGYTSKAGHPQHLRRWSPPKLQSPPLGFRAQTTAKNHSTFDRPSPSSPNLSVIGGASAPSSPGKMANNSIAGLRHLHPLINPGKSSPPGCSANQICYHQRSSSGSLILGPGYITRQVTLERQTMSSQGSRISHGRRQTHISKVGGDESPKQRMLQDINPADQDQSRGLANEGDCPMDVGAQQYQKVTQSDSNLNDRYRRLSICNQLDEGGENKRGASLRIVRQDIKWKEADQPCDYAGVKKVSIFESRWLPPLPRLSAEEIGPGSFPPAVIGSSAPIGRTKPNVLEALIDDRQKIPRLNPVIGGVVDDEKKDRIRLPPIMVREVFMRTSPK